MPKKADGTNFTSWGLNWRISFSRVAKYKQRRQLQTRQGMSRHEELSVGACTALSTAWITSHRNNPNQAPADRVESFNSDADFVNHNRVAGKFNGTAASSQAERVAIFSEEAFGTSRQDVVKKTHTQHSLAEFSATTSFLDAHPGHYMMVMPITNHPTSHICALHAGPTEMRFFDPNFGEFRCNNSDRGSFFVRLKAQYEDYVNAAGVKKKLEFNNGWVFAGVL